MWESTQHLTQTLEDLDIERKRIRRILFKRLRENRCFFRNDEWLMNKMNHNWLGDLPDSTLIRYSVQIKE